jgi:hypothetical protein
MPKRRQPRIKTISSAKHHNYALVSDLALQMARENGTTTEICFQQILAAFWSGKLCDQLFCFVLPKRIDTPGRHLVALPSRDEIAKGLLGQQRTIDAKALGELSGWTLDDYQNDDLFRDYIPSGRPPERAPVAEQDAPAAAMGKTVAHPTLGLAIGIADFRRWGNRDPDPIGSVGGRTTKLQGIVQFIKRKYGQGPMPPGVTYKTIARDFRTSGGGQVSERTVGRALRGR